MMSCVPDSGEIILNYDTNEVEDTSDDDTGTPSDAQPETSATLSDGLFGMPAGMVGAEDDSDSGSGRSVQSGISSLSPALGNAPQVQEDSTMELSIKVGAQFVLISP